MSARTIRGMPLAGIALGGAAAVAVAMVVSAAGGGVTPQRPGYVVLPQPSPTRLRASPSVVATPGPANPRGSSPANSTAGIWSTPAEFAPPE